MATNPYSKAEYQRNRRILLAEGARCALRLKGCTKVATTVDHINSIDHGGDNSLDNLRPSCAECNSKRGAIQRNKKAAAKREAARPSLTLLQGERANGKPKKAGSFGSSNKQHPAALSSVYASKSGRSKRKNLDVDVDIEIGRDAPRLLSPLPGGVSDYSREITAWADVYMNFELMPWQVIELAHTTAHFNDVLCHRQHLTSVSRQQGKTVDIQALVGWWLTGMCIIRGRPQSVLSTAHTLPLAQLLFQSLAPVLEKHFDADVKWSYGRSELRLPCGCTWRVQAATPSAGHGTSNDLIVADEIWDVSSVSIDQGFLPSQRARKSPLFAAWSTAGTEGSEVMLRMREAGLRAIDSGKPGSTGLAEWSIPPGVDPWDEQWWRWANPAMGHAQHGMTLETLRQEAESPERTAFMRAALNLFVASDRGWLEPGVWDRLSETFPEMEGGVVACDSSQDGQSYAAVRAQQVADTTRVEISGQFESEPELWKHLTDVMTDRHVLLAVSPTLEVHLPEQWRERSVTVGYGELARWTSIVRDAIRDARVCHRNQQAMNDHVARAVAAKTPNGVVLASTRSPGPIHIARCLVWAVALASKPVQRKAKPAMGAG